MSKLRVSNHSFIHGKTRCRGQRGKRPDLPGGNNLGSMSPLWGTAVSPQSDALRVNGLSLLRYLRHQEADAVTCMSIGKSWSDRPGDCRPLVGQPLLFPAMARKRAASSSSAPATKKSKASPLADTVICITGTLSLPRKALVTIIEENGGSVRSNEQQAPNKS